MPVVTIGANSTDTYSGVDDAEIHEGTPTSNWSSATAMEVSKYGGGDHRHSLIRFTGLSNITGPVTVNSATLYLYLFDVSGTSQTIAARQLLRNWVNAQATWNVYSTGNSWTTAGCLSDGNDRVGTAVGSSGAIGTVGSYKAITGLASIVQDWINGAANNYGLHLERSDGQNNAQYMAFRTSEGTDGERPYLEIDYTEGGGGGTILPQIMQHYYG